MLEVIVGLLAFILLLIIVAAAVGAGIWWARRKPVAQPAESSTPRGTPVKRIDLSGGQWAKVRTRLTQYMWDALVAARPRNVEQDDAGRIIDASGADVTGFVTDTIARALIVAGVTEWSYGEVDQDVLISDVPLDDQQTLSDYLDGVLSASQHFRRLTGGS